MYDIFDPSKLTDDDLRNKRFELSNAIINYRRTNYMHLVESMELTLAVVEEELEYRFAKATEVSEAARLKKIKAMKYKKKGTKKKAVIKPDYITIGFIKGVDDVKKE